MLTLLNVSIFAGWFHIEECNRAWIQRPATQVIEVSLIDTRVPLIVLDNLNAESRSSFELRSLRGRVRDLSKIRHARRIAGWLARCRCASYLATSLKMGCQWAAAAAIILL